MDNFELSTFEDVRKSHVDDVEEWKDIEGYEGLYQISSFGRVLSLDRYVVCGDKTLHIKEKLLSICVKDNGYPIVRLSKNGVLSTYMVHRLVGIHHISNPGNLPELNHKDGIKTNCYKWNLEWCTSKYNSNHAYETGLSKVQDRKGIKNSRSILSNDDVIRIKQMSKEGASNKDIGKIYNFPTSHIWGIVTGKIWKHVNPRGEGKTATEGTLNNT